MAKLKEHDPAIAEAAARRDRYAALHAADLCTDALLEQAEADLSAALVAADRRAEREAAVAREAAKVDKAERDRATRWTEKAAWLSERLIEREVAAQAVRMALADFVEAVTEWRMLPPVAPMLADAPGPAARWKDRAPDALKASFAWTLRHVADTLGLPTWLPNPPALFRQPLDEVVVQLDQIIWNAIHSEGSQ